MADIHHHFPINAGIEKVFEKISTPSGLDAWWSKLSSGNPIPGAIYEFYFGPGYNWKAIVSKFLPNAAFELQFIESDADWNGSKVGFNLTSQDEATNVQFYHVDWREDNEHFRISNYCWAMYLRILKRNLEFGEIVLYEERLNV